MPIKCLLGGVDYSTSLKGLDVSPGGDGLVGSASLSMDALAGGLTIVNMLDVKVWQTFNAAGAGVASKGRLFGGHINMRDTGNAGATKLWKLALWDYNIILAKTVRDVWWAGVSTPIVLAAGHFNAQIQSLATQMQNNGGAAPPVVIDVSSGVVDFTPSMPAVTYPGGHKWSWYIQQLCYAAQVLVPAIRPHFFMGTETTFGVGDVFGSPMLNIYDGASTPGAVATFSDTPGGGEFFWFGDFKRVDDSTVLTQRIQSVFNEGILTSYDSTSQAAYPNPYINHGGASNSGYWMDEIIKDSGSATSAQAQAALDRLIAAKSNPKETYTFETDQRVMPGDYVNITNSLEGLSAQKYRVAQVKMTLEPPDVIWSKLTIGNRRLLLFDTGEEEIAGVPIEGDHVPPLAPASFAITSNTYDGTRNKAAMVFAIGASPSPDAAGYIIWGIIDGAPYAQDVLAVLTPTLYVAPGVSYSLQVYAYDRAGNHSPSTPVGGPLTGTTAARPAAPAAPTLGTITDGMHGPNNYWMLVPVNHAALVNNQGGWVAVTPPVGPIRAIPIPPLSPWPTVANIIVDAMTVGMTYQVQAMVIDQYGQESPFCTAVAHTVGQKPSYDLSPGGFDNDDADDNLTIAGWLPISPAVIGDFSVDATVAPFSGFSSLKAVMTAGQTKEIESPQFYCSPTEIIDFLGAFKKGAGLITMTGSMYVQPYQQDGVTAIGARLPVFTGVTVAAFPNKALDAAVTMPALAMRFSLIYSATSGSGTSAWFAYPDFVRQIQTNQVALGAMAFANLGSAVVNAIPGGSLGTGLKTVASDASISVSHTNEYLLPPGSITDFGGGVVGLDFDTPFSAPLGNTTTFSNSTAENTLCSANFTGSRVSTAGSSYPPSFNLRAFGRISNGASGHTTTIRIKVGSVTVFTIAVSTLTGANTPWSVDCTVTIRTNGVSGTAWAYLSSSINSVRTEQTSTATFTVDTTTTFGIAITEQFSALSVSDTISADQATLR